MLSVRIHNRIPQPPLKCGIRPRAKPLNRGDKVAVELVGHQRRIASRFLTHGVGKAPVHDLICVEVLRAEDRLYVGPMAQRPQPFVREPVVVPSLFTIVEPHPSEAVQRIGGRHVQPVPPIDDDSVGGAGTMCHPYS